MIFLTCEESIFSHGKVGHVGVNHYRAHGKHVAIDGSHSIGETFAALSREVDKLLK
jgi:hypothetical protein